MEKIVNCPQCQAPVAWGSQSPFRPFCSARCRQIDLGAWASGEYCVPGEQPLDDFADFETTATLPTPRE